MQLMENSIFYEHHYLDRMEMVFASWASPFSFHRTILHGPGSQYRNLSLMAGDPIFRDHPDPIAPETEGHKFLELFPCPKFQ